MEAGFWNANSRTNEIAFKFGTELTSTSRRFDRFAPEAVPQMLIPRIERWATGRRKIRGLSNEPTPLPKHRPATNTAARSVRPAQIGRQSGERERAIRGALAVKSIARLAVVVGGDHRDRRQPIGTNQKAIVDALANEGARQQRAETIARDSAEEGRVHTEPGEA